MNKYLGAFVTGCLTASANASDPVMKSAALICQSQNIGDPTYLHGGSLDLEILKVLNEKNVL